MILDELERIVQANSKLEGWDFSRVRAGRNPVPWEYTDIDNISLIKMDGNDLRFDADEFDVILLRHVHVYVSEIVRVLRPGGYFIILETSQTERGIERNEHRGLLIIQKL
jgi:ubiquinone/menaquinone biosynthesis C-methylase UbiE